MMTKWSSTLLYFSLLCNLYSCWSIGAEASGRSILQTMFGVPNECIHQNSVQPCKLTFSCWLQGGKSSHGCGSNKWLFSCCVAKKEIALRPKVSAFASNIIYVNGPPSLSIIGSSEAAHNELRTKYVQAQLKQQRQQTVLKHPKSSQSLSNVLRRRTDHGIEESEHNGKCGIPNTFRNIIQKRIIGGRTAQFAEYPWQAHIRIAEFQCGGVLVSRRFIATAAHCIQQARVKDIIVYLGELDTQNAAITKEPLPAERYRVIKKVIHPRFQFRVTQPDRFDLALLQLSKPAVYKNHIIPICLPSMSIRTDLTGQKGVIAGWGKTQTSMGHIGTNILQSAQVPIISNEDCLSWHESKQISVEIFEEMFCAGHSDGHQDACLGDSGGPLIVADSVGRFTLVGITSAGFGCGIDHQPGIYHNVQLTTKWIHDVIYNKYF